MLAFMSAVESLQGPPPVTARRRNQLTPAEKVAIIAAVASGQRKRDIAKDYGLHPSQISRMLTDVKSVNRESNPLSKDWKARVMPKLQRTVERGLDYKGDPIGAANMAVKVMYGAGYLSTSSKVEMDADIRLTVAWQPVQGAEYASVVSGVGDAIDTQARMLSDGESTTSEGDPT